MTTAIIEKQDIPEGKTTLVRRVSDLFRGEGNNAKATLALRHTSMQKLRHCCQNLNLFPILLYSFSHPMARPMTMSKINLALLITRITERIYRVYSTIRLTIVRLIYLESIKPSLLVTTDKTVKTIVKNATLDDQRSESSKLISRSCDHNFEKFVAKKPKRNSLFLKFIVYLVPLLLAFQMFALFSLMIFGKYSPGFIFLFSTLIFLGCILMKVLNYESTTMKTLKRDKRKND